LNRLVTSKQGGGGGSFIQTESYNYDAAGNLKTYSDGRGGAVSQKFNELNHLTERVDGESNKATFVRDGEGLLTEMTEPCGNGGANCTGGAYRTSYIYNAFGSVTKVTDANTKSWSYSYYDDGKLLKEAADSLSRKISYEYDKIDRLLFVRQPMGLTTSYTYDDNDNVTSIQDPNGQIQTITPDALDRPDVQSYADSSGAEKLKYDYSYDAEDNIYRIDESINIGTPASYVSKRSFDGRNRLQETVDKFGHKVGFTYDKANNIRSITDYKTEASAAATTTGYVYDRQNRLQTITLPNSETVNYSWRADGLPEKVDYTSGMKREYSYDNADRVTTIKNTVNANETQQFNYVYDANSNRTSEQKLLQGQLKKASTYKYDTLNRLTETRETSTAPNTQPLPSQTLNFTEGSSIANYEYDAVGNREKEHTQSDTVQITRTADAAGVVSETRSAPQITPRRTATAIFDQINRLRSLTDADSVVTDLEYDNNGNLTQIKRDSEIQQTFEYDPRNQLRKVMQGQSTQVASYDYDSDKKRVEKTVSGFEPERYVYAGDKVVAEYRGATGYEQNLAKYHLGANEVVKGDFAAEGSKYFFTNALGSTSALAGKVGGNWTATNSYDYDSWGKATATGDTSNSIGYTGQRLDRETGLMALGNGERYYSPTLARFIQQDRLAGQTDSPQTLNRFGYTINNPYKYTDPTGNEIFTILLIGAALIALTSVGTGTIRAKSEHELQAIEQNWEAGDARTSWGSAFADGVGMTTAFKGWTGTDPYKGSVDAYEGKPSWHRAWDMVMGPLEVVGNATAVAAPIGAGISALGAGRATIGSAWSSLGSWAKNTKPLVQEVGAVWNAVKHPLQTLKSGATFVKESYNSIRSTISSLTQGGVKQTAQRAWNSTKNFIKDDVMARFNPKNYTRKGWDVNFSKVLSGKTPKTTGIRYDDDWKKGIWDRSDATQRGNEIEDFLSQTEYKDWYNVGSSNNGFFEAIDFAKGGDVISLKSIDPIGKSGYYRLRNYVNKLDDAGEILIGNNPAKKILDIRVRPGAENMPVQLSKNNTKTLQDIVNYGASKNIEVRISPFSGE
jgi:RHS repeat-associated protein